MPMQSAYDPSLVGLSVLIAICASYAALDLMGRARGPYHNQRWPWVAGAAFAMGGGIWAMHFLGMLAFSVGSPVVYDIGLTALSFAIAVGATGLAFAWASRQTPGGRTLLLSGPLLGLAIAGMHYTGMAAMRLHGTAVFDPVIVLVSVAFAVVAATVGLWLVLRPHGAGQQVAASIVIGIAVAGMHYTGMAAATFSSAGGHDLHPGDIALRQENLALYVAGASFLILLVAMLAASIDRQHGQMQLQESEERFRAAVRAVHGVLWTNDSTGHMRPPQPGWAALTGQSEEQYKGQSWADAVHPDDAAASVASWNGAVSEKRPYVFEHRILRHDGVWRNCAVRAVPILQADGAVREWVGVHTDITEQRAAEAELRESNEELQRYAYIVSHDLRAPLVNVIGFASEIDAVRDDIRMALGAHPNADTINRDLADAVTFIKASATKMDRLIAALLKLSREGRRTLKAEPLVMTPMLEQLADAIRHQTESANATIAIAADLPNLVADRLAVETVFGNLLDNAVKYLDGERAGRITVTGHVAGGSCHYRVSDNGRGIAANDQERVFDLFRRAGRQDRPGDGVGLAQVRATVRLLGGRIKLESTEGQGSTFAIRLPVNGVATASQL